MKACPLFRIKAGDTHVPLDRGALFALMHVMPLGALFVEVVATDWIVMAALYGGRMIGITAGYHRYFAHRTYKMGRVMQFLVALLGTTACQKGVLWWAAHHRHHHGHSDLPDDVHSPRHGFWWSHIGWIVVDTHDETRWERIRDFSRYPELRFLNTHWWLPPTALGVLTLLAGGWGTLFVGFFLSTVLLYHATFLVNSAAHMWGSRRYATRDTSRNNALIALLTCGEGWHNNHHHASGSARQGFFWWEIDVSYYAILLLRALGLARDVRTPSPAVLMRDRLDLRK
jgi:stearoyl-CoA desaturase (delta-9 desaturase)